MPRNARILAALAAACLLIAGCGSSGTDTTTTQVMTPKQYGQFLIKEQQRENAAHKAVEESFRATSVQQIARAMSAFAEDQEARANDLSAVEPPENAKPAQAKLEKAFEETAAAINGLIPEVEKASSAKEALAAIQKASGSQQAGRELESALGELTKLGYTSGS